MTLRSTPRQAATGIALVLALLWPAIYNGQPFFYPDTTAYVRGADAAFAKLSGHRTVWSQRSAVSLSSVQDNSVLAGRSIYYGTLLYIGHLAGRLWPAVLIQALAVIFALALTLHAYGWLSWSRLAITSLLLAVLTPVGFFVSLLMPDVFAALAVMAVGNLLAPGPRTKPWMSVCWIALLTAALLFHTSHVLITAALLVVTLLVAAVAKRSVPMRGVVGVLVAILVAIAGDIAFSAGVSRVLGSPPIRPPFLTARMIADGTGSRYLISHCPAADFAACGFVDRLPIADPDTFLWSVDSARGVFAVTDPATRRRLGNEQLRFAAATAAFDPLGQSEAILRNSWFQIGRVGLEEFQYPESERRFFDARVPEPYISALRRTRAWNGSMNIGLQDALVRIVTLLSTMWLVIGLVRLKSPTTQQSAARAFSLIVIAGIICNAAICGALSTPHDRYQARVAWLLPMLVALQIPRRSRDSATSAPMT